MSSFTFVPIMRYGWIPWWIHNTNSDREKKEVKEKGMERDTVHTSLAVNLEPWVTGLKFGFESTGRLSSEAGNHGALVEHSFIDLWHTKWWLSKALLPVSLSSYSRNWWLVPSRLQCPTVAADGPGQQSGDYSSGHAGKTRELWLGDKLPPDVQRHRAQLAAVQARGQHLGRECFVLQWMAVRCANASQWAFLGSCCPHAGGA